MARRRRSGGDVSEAFDMFLDTISNAFGGIIFISLLVCVMLQLSGAPAQPAAVDPTDEAKVRHDIAVIEAEISGLQAARDAQLAQIAKLSPISDELANEYIELSKKEKELWEKLSKMIDDLTGLQVEVNKLHGDKIVLTGQRDQLVAQKIDLEKVLAALNAPSGISLRVPGFHHTRKRQVAAVLSGSRLAFVMKYDAQGMPVAQNEDDVEFVAAAGKTVIKPKAGRGLLIETPEKLAAALAPELGKLGPKATPARAEDKCHYLTVFLWPDSFAEFETFRELLIKQGFDYGLIFMAKDESIIATDTGEPGWIN